MNTARNIAHWRKVWRNALIAHGVDVSAVPDSAVAVWPLSVGKPARYALALTSRQANPDTAAGLWVSLSAWNQIADLLAILGAMEWKISHGPILDLYGAATICGHKAAGAAALNVTSGWWPGDKLAIHWVTGPRPVPGLEAGILADARTWLHEGGTLDPDEPAEPVRRA